MVGPDADELTDPPPNLHLHGLLRRREYLPLLAEADVAIGSLALHRKSMEEASPLKVAEYLAYGLPTIIGYSDGRFPDGAPFLLRLPNVEDSIGPCIGAIEEFVGHWRGRRVERASIGGIDARLVEGRRLEFIRSVTASDGVAQPEGAA